MGRGPPKVPRARWLGSLVAVGFLLVLAVSSSPAQAYIYWPEQEEGIVPAGEQPSGLQSANPEGTNVQWVRGAPSSILDVVTDGAHLYFTESNATTIGRMTSDGTGVNNGLVHVPTPTCGPYPGQPTPRAIAVDGSYIYWTDPSNGTIGRAGTDGSSPNDDFMSVYYPCGSSGFGRDQGPGGVAIAGGHIYWTNPDDGTIGRANVDGTGANQSFISGASQPAGIAVAGSDVYWSSTPITGAAGDSIGHARLDSSGALIPASVTQNFIPGVGEATQLTTFGGYLYFDDGDGWIGRSTLDGGTVVRHLTPLQDSGPLLGNLSVDSGHSSPTTTSVSCSPSTIDVLQEPYDPEGMTVVNLRDTTLCTFRVRESSSTSRPVNGTISFAQSPSEGIWLFPRGKTDDSPTGSCRLVPTSTAGLSSCTVGYASSPDANGFVHGATRTAFAVAYGGETTHDASVAASFRLPLVIVHLCGQTGVPGDFLVCDARGRVVNRGAGSRGSSKAFPVGGGHVTLTVPPSCVAAGRRVAVKLVPVFPRGAHTTVQRVQFSLGHGRAITLRHRPYVVRLTAPRSSHGRLQLKVRIFMTARHRHVVKTISMALRVC
jgi:hypothetical protein